MSDHLWDSAADTEVAQEHAQWREPVMVARLGATHASMVEGVDAAIRAWVAEEGSRVSGQGTTKEEEKVHEGLASNAKARELFALMKFKLFEPVEGGNLPMSVMGTRQYSPGAWREPKRM